MKLLVLLLIVTMGAILAGSTLIKASWQYSFGFMIGIIVSLIITMWEDR